MQQQKAQETPQPIVAPAQVGAMSCKPWPAPSWVDRFLSIEIIWVALGLALVDVPGLPLAARAIGWLLLLLGWPLRWFYRRAIHTPLDGPAAVFALGLLVGMYASVDRRLSFEALQTFLGAIMLYYAVVNSRSPRVVVGIACLGVAATLFFIPWVFAQGQIPPSKLLAYNQWAMDLAARFFPRVGPYAPHMNALAGGLNAIIPLLVGMALFGSRLWLRAGSGVVALLLINTVLMSGSRAGWIGLSVALLMVAVLWWRWLVLLVPLGAAAAALIAFAGAIESNDLLAITSGQTLIGRTEVWRTSLDMLLDVPFTGVGLASYPLVYSFYTPPSLPVGVTNPHNALIQLYSDTGLLGSVALVWGAWAVAGVVRDTLKVAPRDGWYGLAIGLAASLAGQAAYGAFESTITMVYQDPSGLYHYMASPIPALLLGLFVCTAHLLGTRARSQTTSMPPL